MVYVEGSVVIGNGETGVVVGGHKGFSEELVSIDHQLFAVKFPKKPVQVMTCIDWHNCGYEIEENTSRAIARRKATKAGATAALRYHRAEVRSCSQV